MAIRMHAGEAARWLGAILVTVAAAVLLVTLGANSTTAGIVFLVLVVWFSAQAGIRLAICVAVLCALSFDYFFLLPYRTLRIVGIQQWVAMISFLFSCAVVSRVAEIARRQTRRAEERRADVERLYTLSQEMMLQNEAAALFREAPGLIGRIFALDGVALYVRDRDECFGLASELPMSTHASLRAISEGAEAESAIPGGFMAMKLMLGMRPVGAWGWRPARLSPEVAAAVSAQVALALARVAAMEASARMEALRESEKLRAALIDSLTHELRTPLTSIRAAATTLIEGAGLDEAGRLDMATIVDEEATRLDALIGEAVEMAEIDANGVKVRAVLQRARTLLEDAVEESQAVLASHRVAIDVQEPDAPVWFDPRLLGRVLRHLIENAARYSGAGSRIVLRSRRGAQRLEFTVEDNGPGIDAADLALIFEKFYRGKRGLAAGKGTGMGLAIARAILRAHGGDIHAASAPLHGATFHFWIPLEETDPAGERNI